MANFAVVEDGAVTNIVIADSKELAESVTGKNCVEYFDNNPAFIGGTYNGSVFIVPQPYPSWSLDSNFNWQPPTPMPTEGFWRWDEEKQNWVEITE